MRNRKSKLQLSQEDLNMLIKDQLALSKKLLEETEKICNETNKIVSKLKEPKKFSNWVTSWKANGYPPTSLFKIIRKIELTLKFERIATVDIVNKLGNWDLYYLWESKFLKRCELESEWEYYYRVRNLPIAQLLFVYTPERMINCCLDKLQDNKHKAVKSLVLESILSETNADRLILKPGRSRKVLKYSYNASVDHFGEEELN